MATRSGGADVNDVYGLQPLCRACLKRYGPEALCRRQCLHPEKHKRSPVSRLKGSAMVYNRLLSRI